jgi:putative FmdB family regulatory protein
MPTYEYDCEACNNEWEAEQRITEDALKDCPKCGAPKARRLISGSRFLLKGSGWYADGYGSSKPAAKSAKGGESTDSKPADSKPADGKAGESKPSEAKPASKPAESKSEGSSGSKGTTAA